MTRPPTRLQTRLIDAVIGLVLRIKPLASLANRMAINRLASRMPPRPNPLSTKDPFTSWTSLTDRKYSGRHLPPVAAGATTPATTKEGPPTVDDAAALFRRDGEMDPCPKSTVLFTYFAQWFTDGFLRTNRPTEAGKLRNTRMNESNHEIDLMQLYGLDVKMTDQLRAHHDGLLKSQTINGEEYPEFLYEHGVRKPEFDSLLPPFAVDGLTPEQRDTLFAMGSDTRNMGFLAFNVLFLREHNRITKELKRTYEDWSDDQLFETTRNILTVVLLKIVVEEYINHITPIPFKFALTADGFTKKSWFRTNWMAVEFNLLYRWHPLVPSIFTLDGKPLTIQQTLMNTPALTSAGLARFMVDASEQAAGRVGLFNTDGVLVDAADKPSIEQGRAAQLRSYNEYRVLCGQPPLESFAQLNSDKKVQDALAGVYDSIDDVEFYVGLFAEKSGVNDVLPPLVLTMVAFDAFTQALTNPLVSPRIFNETTFSKVGMAIIKKDQTISGLVRNNVAKLPVPYFVSLTRSGYRRV